MSFKQDNRIQIYKYYTHKFPWQNNIWGGGEGGEGGGGGEEEDDEDDSFHQQIGFMEETSKVLSL